MRTSRSRINYPHKILLDITFWTAMSVVVAAAYLGWSIANASRPLSNMERIQEAIMGTPTFEAGNKDNSWDKNSTSFGKCRSKGAAYTVISLPSDTLKVCLNKQAIIGDFTLLTQMTIQSGINGGIVFHWNPGHGYYNDFYYFFLTINGWYGIQKGVDQKCPGKGCIQTLHEAFSPFIHKGLNKINEIIIMVSGNSFYLSVNGQFLTVVSDSDAPFSIGGIGFAVGFVPGDVIFANWEIWEHAVN